MTHKGLRLDGKTALVTGAGRGIGYEIANVLPAAGARVVAHYRSSRAGVEKLLAEYGKDRVFPVQADFEEPGAPSKVFDAARSWAGPIEILVNNAAWVESVPSIDEVDEALLTRSLQVNSVAPFMLTKLVIKEMRALKSGRIVAISSIGVKYVGSSQTPHYMVSKAALEAGMLALAKSAAPEGVLVNVIRAGVTRTSAHARLGRDDISGREKMIPLRRAAEPSEIANAVLFLVSPLNTFITGTIVPVAGGE